MVYVFSVCFWLKGSSSQFTEENRDLMGYAMLLPCKDPAAWGRDSPKSAQFSKHPVPRMPHFWLAIFWCHCLAFLPEVCFMSLCICWGFISSYFGVGTPHQNILPAVLPGGLECTVFVAVQIMPPFYLSIGFWFSISMSFIHFYCFLWRLPNGSICFTTLRHDPEYDWASCRMDWDDAGKDGFPWFVPGISLNPYSFDLLHAFILPQMPAQAHFEGRPP